MEDPNNIDHYRIHKKRRVACSQCRQSKLRCGADENPCPRCKRLGLNCTKDPSYRRVSRQSKVEELELQVNQLRGIVGSQPGTASSPPTESSHTGSAATDHFPNPSIPTILPSSSRTPSEVNQLPAEGHKSLGSISIDPSQIESLFSIYFEQYHHYLPYLNRSKPPEQYYQSSPLLFWSIVSVAARQYRANSSLLSGLCPSLTELLGTTIASNPMNLATAQALLLLGTWPPPTVRLWTDNSFVLVSIALTTLQHVEGRESSLREADQSSTMEHRQTWLACVIMSHCISIEHGYLPPVSLSQWTITCVLQPEAGLDFPTELRHNLTIQRCSNKAVRLLSQNEDNALGLPSESERHAIVARLEHDFDAIADDLSLKISFINKLRLQAARLFLQAVYFIDCTLKDSLEAKSGVLRAYSTASVLVSGLLSESHSYDQLSHAPLSIFRMIFSAAFVIWKVLNSSYGASLDREAGKVLFNAATFAIRQISVQNSERDLPVRAAEGLSFIWRCGESDLDLRLQPPTVALKSRMESSLVYDCILRMRDYKLKLGMPHWPGEKGFKDAQSYIDKNRLSSSSLTNGIDASGVTADSILSQNIGMDNWEAMPDMNWIWEYEV